MSTSAVPNSAPSSSPSSSSPSSSPARAPKAPAAQPAAASPAAAPDRDEVMAPTTDAIAKRAYEKFLARGGEHGHHEEDWQAAERELRNGPPPQR